MFKTKHYVPILRWKQAERLALRYLYESDKTRITPFIELIPKPFRPPKRGKWKDVAPDCGSVLRHTAKEMLRHWGYAPAFVDFQHLEGIVGPINGRIHPFGYFAELARSYKLHIVPVTGLNRSITYQAAVCSISSADGNGICVRLKHSDVRHEDCLQRIRDLLGNAGTTPEQVDLILDYESYENEAPEIGAVLRELPFLHSWRSLTVARGAFPKDLQGFNPGMHVIPRSDWLAWKQDVLNPRLSRKPAFADYTIQYGRYEEPPDNANPSASIRYTLDEQWLVLRGEGIFNEDGPGRAQWNAHARLLVDRDEFYGERFSYGDAYVNEMSNKPGEHGSPMTWIRAGLNHHITVVSQQIAAL